MRLAWAWAGKQLMHGAARQGQSSLLKYDSANYLVTPSKQPLCAHHSLKSDAEPAL
jgi:hypothetical protein